MCNTKLSKNQDIFVKNVNLTKITRWRHGVKLVFQAGRQVIEF